MLRQLLRESREAAGVSQEGLSTRLSRAITYIGKVEAGTRRLDVIELRQIISALGVGLLSFMTELEKRLTATHS